MRKDRSTAMRTEMCVSMSHMREEEGEEKSRLIE
jgi:hypothetical protein